MASNSGVGVSEALAECLDALLRQEDVVVYLTKYWQHRERLQELLDVASKVRLLPREVVPPPAFVQRTKVRVVRRVYPEDETQRFP